MIIYVGDNKFIVIFTFLHFHIMLSSHSVRICPWSTMVIEGQNYSLDPAYLKLTNHRSDNIFLFPTAFYRKMHAGVRKLPHRCSLHYLIAIVRVLNYVNMRIT